MSPQAGGSLDHAGRDRVCPVVARDREEVLGLTTAAAIGIAAGLGHYVMAAGSTLLLLIVLRVLARFDHTA
jgi:uncharacterized membrane protein YhiD involved in acid resistance